MIMWGLVPTESTSRDDIYDIDEDIATLSGGVAMPLPNLGRAMQGQRELCSLSCRLAFAMHKRVCQTRCQKPMFIMCLGRDGWAAVAHFDKGCRWPTIFLVCFFGFIL
jgi:hypothetical protein